MIKGKGAPRRCRKSSSVPGAALSVFKRGVVLLLTFLGPHAFSADLRDQARNDLAYIYNTVKENHPGFVDKQNPDFRKWLDKGYRIALKEAVGIRSEREHIWMLKAYVAGFADGHFFLHVNDEFRSWRWAGIVIGRAAGEYRVKRTAESWAPSMPPVGATLLECDGRGVEMIMKEELLKYHFNNASLEFPKVAYASWLFVDDGFARRNLARNCTFRIGSRLQTYPIVWREVESSPLPEQVVNMEFGIEGFDTNAYWVRVPGFKPDLQAQQKLEAVIAELEQLQEARLIVFDVRGNTGGNSAWALELIRSVYPRPAIEAYLDSTNVGGRAMWRVSADNLSYLESILPGLIVRFGQDSELVQEISGLVVRMGHALERGDELVEQSSTAGADPSPEVQAPLPKAPIILITDAYCGSACLDFADHLLNLPGVTHMGQETGADTVYMDIRPVELPSGLGKFSLAQKLYRGRPRLHNQSYTPAHVYAGDIEDTKALKVWVRAMAAEQKKAE